MSSDINSLIESSFDAVSVLLVFVTVLFSLRYPEIKKLLDEPLQTDKPIALKRQKKAIKNDLFYKWLPVVFLNFVIVYLLTPLAIKTIINSKVAIINFDFIKTSLVLIWYLNIALLLSSIYLLFQILIKLKKST